MAVTERGVNSFTEIQGTRCVIAMTECGAYIETWAAVLTDGDVLIALDIPGHELQFETREVWLRLAKAVGSESPPWPVKSREHWLLLSKVLPYLAAAIESGKLGELRRSTKLGASERTLNNCTQVPGTRVAIANSSGGYIETWAALFTDGEVLIALEIPGFSPQFKTREVWLRLAKAVGSELPPWPLRSRENWLRLSKVLPYLAAAIESGSLDETYSALSVEARIALSAEARRAIAEERSRPNIDLYPHAPDLSVPNTEYWRTGRRR